MLHRDPNIVAWRTAGVVASYYFNLAAQAKERARADFRTAINTRRWEKLISDDTREQLYHNPGLRENIRLGSRVILRLPENYRESDLDNLLKSIWDGMQNLAYANDKQFDYCEIVRQFYDGKPLIETELLIK